jgi:hypothetical protein
MSIEGRINVDALFHDSDGTTSLKVLSIQDSDAYASGIVAYWSGTCGSTAVTLQFAPTTYRNAAGNLVTVQPSDGHVVFHASGNGGRLAQANGSVHLVSVGHVCTSNLDEQESISVAGLAGTTQYTVLVWSAS